VAGAEVVEGDVHAEIVQVLKGLHRPPPNAAERITGS
jgi:hypothetical protein